MKKAKKRSPEIMVGRDKCHHFAAGTGRHTHHVYDRIVRQGLLRAARSGEGASMPENLFHGQRSVDVMVGEDGITIIAELFGVHAEDLMMNLEGDSLIISAGQLRKNIALPRPAKSIIMKSFKNGILELKLEPVSE
jgi:HSP20 family molecular chaperone IbpA